MPASTPPPLTLTAAYLDAMDGVLRRSYFNAWPPDYLASGAGQKDLQRHVSGRMMDAELCAVPWVNDAFPLASARIVEIGCGTGSATVAFARHAGHVHAIDVSEGSLDAARGRAELLAVQNVSFERHEPNWTASSESIRLALAGAAGADVVLLFAALEHLTIAERIDVLREAFALLRPRGVLVVYETPNRLGWFDWHSFRLPFFHWLPDELAIRYAGRTPRPFFDVPEAGDRAENLYRLGRGVSFHEFELALDFGHIEVLADSGSSHLARRRGLDEPRFDAALRALVAEHAPHVPPAFAYPSLDLVLRKTGAGS